ncbi:hypothetical protein ABIE35_002374 [Paenarthrobacter sp. 4246]
MSAPDRIPWFKLQRARYMPSKPMGRILSRIRPIGLVQRYTTGIMPDKC